MAHKQFGLDGQPHLTYYDAALALSFIWDGTEGPVVAVSQGGYAERATDWFNWHPAGSVISTKVPFQEVLADFRESCQAYIIRTRGRAALVAAYTLGLEEAGGEAGITYENDPASPRSRAYDQGRQMGRELLKELGRMLD